MEQLKCCRKCGIEKPLTEFHKAKGATYGVTGACKSCSSAIKKEYYLQHKSRIRQRAQQQRKTYVPKFSREVGSRLKYLCTKARNRDKEFSLVNKDLLDVFEVQQGLCAYTKLPLVATANQFNTISLDRIDSSKGYHKDNIQLVCAAINKMKQEYTEQMFISLCHLVAQNNELSDLPENILTRK